MQFGFGFDVELADAAGEGQRHLVTGFADAGKHDALARNACGPGAQVFTARDHIHASAKIAQEFQDGDVGQGLDGKADLMRQGGQRLGEQLVVPGQGGCGIDVERCSDRGRDIVDRDILGHQFAVPVEEMIHQRRVPSWAPSFSVRAAAIADGLSGAIAAQDRSLRRGYLDQNEAQGARGPGRRVGQAGAASIGRADAHSGGSADAETGRRGGRRGGTVRSASGEDQKGQKGKVQFGGPGHRAPVR